MVKRKNLTPEIILEDLYRRKKLGPFYIIRPPVLDDHPNPTKQLDEWCQNFVANIISIEKGFDHEKAKEQIKLGFSDFSLIEKNPDNRAYKVDDEGIKEFFKAQSYPPLESSYKIVAVRDADKLNQQVANKWLKTLEEPIDRVTTLFLVGNNRPLLKTLESRAITLRLRGTAPNIDQENQIAAMDFSHFLKDQIQNEDGLGSIASESQKGNILKYCENNQSYHYFLDSLKGSHELQEEMFKVLSEYFEKKATDPKLLDRWLEEIKWFQKAKTYNNSPSERFLGLLQLIQQINA